MVVPIGVDSSGNYMVRLQPPPNALHIYDVRYRKNRTILDEWDDLIDFPPKDEEMFMAGLVARVQPTKGNIGRFENYFNRFQADAKKDDNIRYVRSGMKKEGFRWSRMASTRRRANRAIMAKQQLKLFPGFRGVDVSHSPLGMPLEWSPHSLNSDFDKNSLRKRRGMRKLFKNAVPPAGLYFKGSGNTADAGPYVLVNSIPDYALGSTWTIECVVRANRPGRYSLGRYLGAKGDGVGIYSFQILVAAINNLSRLFFYDAGDTAYQTDLFTITPDQPIHVAVVRNGNDGYVYLNGVQDHSADWTGAGDMKSTTEPLVIAGTYNSGLGGVVTGDSDFEISEFRMWKGHNRSQAELQAYMDMPLDLDGDPDCADYLVGYWPLDEGDGRIVSDRSKNRNHGFLNKAICFYEPSPLVGGSEEFALGLDGYDDYARVPYDAAYEPIDDTSKYWTVEVAFMPYWINPVADNVILKMGDAFEFRIESTDGDYEAHYIDSGPVTETCDSGVRAEVGVPVMLSLVRDFDSLELYVNGASVGSVAVSGSNTGPNDGADIYVGRKSDGTLKSCGLVDEIRLWTYSRSAQEIADNWNRRLPDEHASGLVGYFKTNAYAALVDSSDTDNDGTLYPTSENGPIWSKGLITAKFPPAIRGIASLNVDMGLSGQTFRQDKALAITPTKRRLVVAAGAVLYDLFDHDIRVVGDGFRVPHPIDMITIDRHLVLANQVDLPQKYDGDRKMNQLGIDAPTTALTGAAGAAGNPNGSYFGKYVYKNSKTGTYSLASSPSAQVTVSGDSIDWSVTASTDPDVDTIEVYRTAAGAASTGTYYLAASGSNTTGTINDDTSDADLAAADAEDIYTGVPPAVAACVAYKNMLVLTGNPAAPDVVYPSEVSTTTANKFEHFYAVSQLRIGSSEGDTNTALIVLEDDCLVGKQNTIWRLQGAGPTSLASRIVSLSHGILNPKACVVFSVGQAEFMAHLDVDGIWAYASRTFRKLSSPFDAYFDGTTSRLNPQKLKQCILGNFRRKNELWAVVHLGDPEEDYGDLLASFNFTQDPTSLGGSEIRDVSGNSRHLTSGGTMTTADLVTGPYGSETALDLDGSDDFLTMPGECLINARTFSVSVWVNFDAVSGEDGYVFEYANTADDRYWNLRLDDTNSELRFNLYDGASTYHADIPFASLTATKWHHIVCTHDGDKSRIYLDGAVVETVDAEAAGYPLDEGSDFHIGSDCAETSGNFLDGKIGRMRISRTVWTADMIRRLYEEGARAIGGHVPFEQETKTLIISYALDADGRLATKTRIIDYGFDALGEIETDKDAAMFVGSKDGFVFELDVDYADGVVEGTVTGTLTSATADSLTDSSATFYADGDGLKGVPIWVKMSNGTIQKRTIWYNTATQIFVTEKWSPATITSGTYYIGPINFVHRTPVIYAGIVEFVKSLDYLDVVQVPQSSANAVTVKKDLNMADSFAALADTFNTDSFDARVKTALRARAFQLEFSQYAPNAQFELLQAEQEIEIEGVT
jgi:hypothetical protein